MTMSKNEHKVRQFSEPLREAMDQLPLYGVHVRDQSKHEWNPSAAWHRHQQEKLGKQFSLRRYGDTLLIIRIR